MMASYFGLWVAGRHKFLCCFGCVLATGIGSGHLLPNLTHFSRFSHILPKILPVLVLFTPIFAVLMPRATLLTPSFPGSSYPLGYL